MHKALLGVILVVIGYYLYNWYQSSQYFFQNSTAVENYSNQGNAESNGADSDLTCTMYYTTWCKFCKKAKPEWAKLTQEFNGKVLNGKKIHINKVDCEQEPEIAEQENIKGYPTFKVNMNGKYYEYPDEAQYPKFKTFIEYLVGLGK